MSCFFGLWMLVLRNKSQLKKKEVSSTDKEERLISQGWRRVVLQPNGWGMTPDQALRDLDRVMRFYEGRPGFRRYDQVTLVRISKRRYQSDGRCSFLAPPVGGKKFADSVNR